jgi:hypothetical protein
VNAYDKLLEWASEVGNGSWQSWRDAAAYLDVNPDGAAQSLGALGHVEFDWLRNRFAVAPSTAVLTLHSSSCLLLTGARRRGVREQLKELDATDEYGIVLREPVVQQEGPETWLVQADVDEMQRFASDAGFGFEIDSGRRMLEALPPATLEACAERERPDDRFARMWLNPKSRFWNTNANPSTDGLWWVDEPRRDIAFIRQEAEWYRVTTREYGPYLAYPDQSFITYNSVLGILTVDNEAPLPPLVARAATLQSGRLASRERTRHSYVNIDEPLADLIAEKLNAYVRWM